MANTYNLITSSTLTTTTASVTFSGIPQTFDDLVIKISARADTVDTNVNIYFRINGDTGSNYNALQMSYYSTGPNQNENQNRTFMDYPAWAAGSNILTNMFGTNELYLPNYTSTSFKVIGGYSIVKNNSTSGWALDAANQWRGSAALTSILMYPYSGNFLAGSTFWIYGIKNT